MSVKDALQRLDSVMAELIEADQTGAGIDPLGIARELGQVRALMIESPAIVPRKGGESHFRCESCGTIVHGMATPERCPACGGVRFFKADLEQPIVDAGPA